jgi:hypothetical protein
MDPEEMPDDMTDTGALDAGLSDATDWEAMLNKRQQDREKAVRDIYAPQYALWDRLSNELKARHSGPSASERLYQLSAALARPTRRGSGVAGVMENLSPVMAAQSAARRTAADEQRDLELRYLQGRMGASTEEQKAILDVGGDIDTLRQRYMTAADTAARARAAALKPKYQLDANSVWRLVPGSGGSTAPPDVAAGAQEVPTQMAIDALAANPTSAPLFIQKFGAPAYADAVKKIGGR